MVVLGRGAFSYERGTPVGLRVWAHLRVHGQEGVLRELYRSVQFSVYAQLLRRKEKRFRGGLVFQAHRLVYHSTLGLRVIKKREEDPFQQASEDQLLADALRVPPPRTLQ